MDEKKENAVTWSEAEPVSRDIKTEFNNQAEFIEYLNNSLVKRIEKLEKWFGL